MVRGRPPHQDELQSLPGVGPSIARDLRDLGINSLAGLRRRDPERMYTRLNRLRGQRQDPCVLYVFRCAVYAARTSRPKPSLLKWWNWKDRSLTTPSQR
jgi:Pathogenicity locus